MEKRRRDSACNLKPKEVNENDVVGGIVDSVAPYNGSVGDSRIDSKEELVGVVSDSGPRVGNVLRDVFVVFGRQSTGKFASKDSASDESGYRIFSSFWNHFSWNL